MPRSNTPPPPNTETALVPAFAKITAELETQTAAISSIFEGDPARTARFKEVVARAIAKDPKLIRCTPLSLMRAIVDAASLGIEPTGKYGGGYLVPFWSSKNSRYEATLIIGYDGLKDMAYRSGIVTLIEGDVVHEFDQWEYVRGWPETRLTHIPAPAGVERGPAIGAWAMVHLRGAPRPLMTFLPEEKIVKRRKVSQSGTNRETGAPTGIWLQWEDEMRMKTALRFVLGLAPKTVIAVVARAFEVEDAGDSLLGEAGEAPAQVGPGTRSRRRRLQAGAGGQVPIEEAPAGSEEPVDGEVREDPEGDAPVESPQTDGEAEVTSESTVEGGAPATPETDGQGQENAGALCGAPNPFEGAPCGLPAKHPDGERVHKEIRDDGEVIATWPVGS